MAVEVLTKPSTTGGIGLDNICHCGYKHCVNFSDCQCREKHDSAGTSPVYGCNPCTIR